MPKLRIRLAKVEDYGAVAELYRELDEDHVALLPEVFQPPPQPARSPEEFLFYLEEPDLDYLVAEYGGLVVGFVNLRRDAYPAQPMYKPHECARIDNIVVARDFRGHGIGKRLIEEARRWAVDRGLQSLELSVWAANTGARAFYRRLGFDTLVERLELKIP